jgi:hypothetical protein
MLQQFTLLSIKIEKAWINASKVTYLYTEYTYGDLKKKETKRKHKID